MIIGINANNHTHHLKPTDPASISRKHRSNLCYSNNSHHMVELDGHWEISHQRVSKYWNLSCPLEVSKQACSHFGTNLTHAEYAARLHFIPNTCNLLTLEDLIPAFSALNKTIYFIGNSLIRQVMLGMVCNAHQMGYLDHIEVKWLSCEQSHHYPCHGATNCVECGPHSGFNHDHSKAFFKGGTFFDSVESYSTEESFFANYTGNIDVIVVQRWHAETRGLNKFATFRKERNLPLPKLIWWNGFNAHFPSGGSLLNGQFNEKELERMKKEEKVIECLNTVNPVQSTPSFAERLGDHFPITAFLGIQGINDFGEAKVGNVVGKFGDCQHFCSPGPADMLSIALMQLILSLYHQLR